MTERGMKIREAFRKKYGVDHPSQLPSVKEKIREKRLSGSYNNMTKKIKQTLLDRYGDENYVNVDKMKSTKMEKYGNETYNNRQKMLQTNIARYGMLVSTNTLESTKNRSNSGELGFKSEKYNSFLKLNNINNISQLESVKNIKRKNINQRMVENIFFGNRLKNIVSPLFTKDEYLGTDYSQTYKFKCNACNNIFEDTLYSGNIPRCLVCFPHSKFKSKIEDEIREFIQLNNISIISHDRKILDGNEIDILIPDKNLGIECDGIIWHSEIFGKKDRKYHLLKTEKANEKNISLIHIWDWEWLNKKEIVKDIIKTKLGRSSKVYARKCNVKEISTGEKSIFLENNHIQGDDNSSIKIGLFIDNELISIMTFVKSRFDTKYEYEMSRYCNRGGTSIIGGASKLYSYFIKHYNPKSIVSYCDRRFFSGKVYEKIGMNLISTTSPSYHYFNKNNCIPINRLQFQKHKLIKKLKSYDPNLTEWENMQLNGYDRIWDCGNFKYGWISPAN